MIDRDACDHPVDDRSVLMEQDGCKVEKCGKCGFAIEDGKVGEFRTCPFCGDWFIDRFGEDGEVCCQGCAATAPEEVWNERA